MLSEQEQKRVARVIDANANRLREGLRVAEEISRLILNQAGLTQALKDKRHLAGDLVARLLQTETLLEARDSLGDMGGNEGFDTLPRQTITDILRANLGRSQEACRVLEEFSKLTDPNIAEAFKRIRFDLYTIEKGMISDLSTTPNQSSV